MRSFIRPTIWLLIGLTGATGLIYQVVWQKYLTFLVGSDSRSVSLVVAFFLLGLAAGYRFWGRFSEKFRDRRHLFDAYGWIEIGIAVWAALFPKFFEFSQWILTRFPASAGILDGYFSDIIWTALLICPPTFLMGSTVPLLTRAMPKSREEASQIHSKIYGTNTAGAVLGTFLAALFLIPSYGLAGTLSGASIVNFLVGLFFTFGAFSSLRGPLVPRLEAKEPAAAGLHRLKDWQIYLFSFLVGGVTLALEVIFVRILGLSMGSSYLTFPIVLGVFVLGLGLGSLSLKSPRDQRIGRVLFNLGAAIALLTWVYFSIPYWGYWMSTIRVILRPIPFNYFTFQVLIIGLCLFLLLPPVYFLGKLLPQSYALLQGKKKEFGKACGNLYFVNTLGTLFGALILGHLLLNWFNFDELILISLSILSGCLLLLAFQSRLKWAFTAGILLIATPFFLPEWDRSSHHIGLFRTSRPTSHHFKKIFYAPSNGNRENLFFEDGPNTTVTIFKNKTGQTLTVNGKSDGHTHADYPTMVFTGSIPYLLGPARTDMKAAVVGLGTGISAGVLAQANEVSNLVVTEISKMVIRGNHLFDEYTADLTQNKKAHLIETDAFRYFRKDPTRFDIIVSEPSNPWVTGVENLFTPEFYNLITNSLAQDGIFFQWIQAYEMSQSTFQLISNNVLAAFPHTKIFQIGTQDIGILASHTPLPQLHENSAAERRFDEKGIRGFHDQMGLKHLNDLVGLELFNEDQLRFAHQLRKQNPDHYHSLGRPTLQYHASKDQFLKSSVKFDRFFPDLFSRNLHATPHKAVWFKNLLTRREAVEEECKKLKYGSINCEISKKAFARLDKLQARSFAQSFKDPRQLVTNLRERLKAYQWLRNKGFQRFDGDLIRSLEASVLKLDPKQNSAKRGAKLVLDVWASEGRKSEGLEWIEKLALASILNKKQASQSRERFLKQIEKTQTALSAR